jgi:dihydroorotate dehydrogenase
MAGMMRHALHLGFGLTRPLLRAMDAEAAHKATIAALRFLPLRSSTAPVPELSAQFFGLTFPNPLGLAAGFDKNGNVIDQMSGLGFGFVEAGTVTPRLQVGNPKPRLFRLTEDQAVINRMGFNNEGHEALLRRLERRYGTGIVGVNIGANKDSVDRIADYVAGVVRFSGVSNYLTVNISSPNTPGLRGLQSRDELTSLLGRLNDARAKLARPVPVLLKIAPDLVERELEDIAACCLGVVDGVIISNTTITRPALKSHHGGEQGGLSGAPLARLATQQLARFYLITDGKLPLIGVGGIDSAEAAWTRIEAGASLLQLYSALVFQGPLLITSILDGIRDAVQRNGLHSYRSAIGRRAQELA